MVRKKKWIRNGIRNRWGLGYTQTKNSDADQNMRATEIMAAQGPSQQKRKGRSKKVNEKPYGRKGKLKPSDIRGGTTCIWMAMIA